MTQPATGGAEGRAWVTSPFSFGFENDNFMSFLVSVGVSAPSLRAVQSHTPQWLSGLLGLPRRAEPELQGPSQELT